MLNLCGWAGVPAEFHCSFSLHHLDDFGYTVLERMDDIDFSAST
jgi:hypothetical protein